MKYDKLFKLTGFKVLWSVVAIALLIMIHNFVSAMSPEHHCDAITFILAIFGVPLYLAICLGYTIVVKLSNRDGK